MAFNWPQVGGQFSNRTLNGVLLGLAFFVILSAFLWYVIVAPEPRDVQVEEISYGWDRADAEFTRLWSDVRFYNPHGSPMRLEYTDYEYRVNDVAFTALRREADEVLPAGSSLTIRLPIEFETPRMADWFQSHLERQESTTVVLQGMAGFRVASENVSIPFAFESTWVTHLQSSIQDLEDCPQPSPQPCIASADSRWHRDGTGWTLQVMLRLENPHDDAVGMRSPVGALAVGPHLGLVSEPSPDVYIAAHGDASLDLWIDLGPDGLLEWWPDHVGACESSDATAMVRFDAYRETASPSPTSPTPTTSYTTFTSTTSPPGTTTQPTTTPTPTPTTTTTTTSPSPTATSPPTTTTSPSTTTTTSTSEPPPPTTTTTSEPPPTTTTSEPPPTTSPSPTSNETGNGTATDASGNQLGSGPQNVESFPTWFSLQAFEDTLAETAEPAEPVTWRYPLEPFQTSFACTHSN